MPDTPAAKTRRAHAVPSPSSKLAACASRRLKRHTSHQAFNDEQYAYVVGCVERFAVAERHLAVGLCCVSVQWNDQAGRAAKSNCRRSPALCSGGTIQKKNMFFFFAVGEFSACPQAHFTALLVLHCHESLSHSDRRRSIRSCHQHGLASQVAPPHTCIYARACVNTHTHARARAHTRTQRNRQE